MLVISMFTGVFIVCNYFKMSDSEMDHNSTIDIYPDDSKLPPNYLEECKKAEKGLILKLVVLLLNS